MMERVVRALKEGWLDWKRMRSYEGLQKGGGELSTLVQQRKGTLLP